jgi:hypothetical protein
MFAFVITLQPVALQTFQSPTTTPVVTRVAATPPASPLATPGPIIAAPQDSVSVSPLIWIVAGLILGGAIVLFVQRASPHDS